MAAQHVDQGQYPVRFMGGQRSGGLVQDEDIAAEGINVGGDAVAGAAGAASAAGTVLEGPGNAHHGAGGRREVPNQAAGMFINPQQFQGGCDVGVLFAEPDRREAAAGEEPVGEGEVIRDRQRVHKAQVLVQEPQAGCVRGRGSKRQGQRLAPDGQCAARIRCVDPGEDLDQGRLSGTVHAQQSRHGAGLDVEADLVQGPLSGESLTDAADAQGGGVLHGDAPEGGSAGMPAKPGVRPARSPGRPRGFRGSSPRSPTEP